MARKEAAERAERDRLGVSGAERLPGRGRPDSAGLPEAERLAA